MGISLAEVIIAKGGGSLSTLRTFRMLRMIRIISLWPALNKFLGVILTSLMELGSLTAILLLCGTAFILDHS